MTRNRTGGIILLAAGAIMLYLGYEASQGIGEQLHETFTGRFTDSTTWYLLLGGITAAGRPRPGRAAALALPLPTFRRSRRG